jgi:hypothetical protein
MRESASVRQAASLSFVPVAALRFYDQLQAGSLQYKE